jgi:hypothetical protein
VQTISVLRFDVVPEQEESFLKWYDEVHTPHITEPGRGFRSVRRYRAVERGMPGYLAEVTSLANQPRNLILLEKNEEHRSGEQRAPRDESGTLDFARWLPHLRHASLIGYRCVMTAEERTVEDHG